MDLVKPDAHLEEGRFLAVTNACQSATNKIKKKGKLKKLN